MSLTADQSRKARTTLGISVRELAEIADVSPNTIARLERGDALHSRTRAHIQGALEAEGILFLAGDIVLRGPSALSDGGHILSSMAKLFAAMWNATDAKFTVAQSYDAVLDLLKQYLSLVQGQGRELDVWERLSLNDALISLDAGRGRSAFACFRHGITPPDNQATDYPIPPEDVEFARPLDLAYFRRCLDFLQARGYQKPVRAAYSPKYVSTQPDSVN